MTPIMLVHIIGGSIALLSGAAALILRKGSRWHAQAGTAFFAAMLVLAGTGAVIAALKPERGTAVIGIFTCYLVTTAWSAARRRDGRPGGLEHAALAVVLGCMAALLSFGVSGLNDPAGRVDSLPWQVHFVFGAVAGLAAILDLNFLRKGQLAGMQRIGRHLWRMSTAMLIATTSFFQGQQDEFPEAWQGAILWNALPLMVLAAMLFWIVRVRFSAAFRKWPPRIAEPAEAAA
ncbi:DUF2306 domain-containing protein [Sphingosinicella sp. LHD-64]|uniref:DUF2306 domain-containing protein n=1 Tax=Sphingosinicella sp. LHD-64 TaxID=3072139 RepID=UPI00280E2FA1|nr:DUF2306 domain-containing protein [Sphingosinicella sp. LHD-64]MDQ8754862.1 DUF2306 domain-containing protein [Sphingosinicella sp. LHD-64]